MSNSLDPDQARRYDLGPNCLQSYQQTTLEGKELTVLLRGISCLNQKDILIDIADNATKYCNAYILRKNNAILG